MLQTTAEVVEGEEKGGFGLQPGLQRACGVDTDLGETHPANSPGKDTWDCTVVVKPNMFVCLFGFFWCIDFVRHFFAIAFSFPTFSFLFPHFKTFPLFFHFSHIFPRYTFFLLHSLFYFL